MKLIVLATLVLLVGCTATLTEERLCLDWGSREVVKEKCIPLYGNLICAEEQVTEYFCKLYEEIGESEDTLHQGAHS